MKDKSKETVFITGASGFLGEQLVRKMIAEQKFRLILNYRNNSAEHPETESAQVDLSDTGSIRAFFNYHQPDHIIHLGALARVREGEENPNDAFQINYLGSKTLIDLAIKNRVRTFVFVSSDLVRNHKSVVGIAKYLTEAYISELDTQETRIVTVRLPNISWTPGSVHLIFERLIKEDKPLTITHPDMSRRFISREQAAELIIHALHASRNKEIWVVTKPPQNITSLAGEMVRDAGKDLSIEFVGMRQGEKLAEEGYREGEVLHTSKEDFSLLKEVNFDKSEIFKAIEMLRAKPGFSLNI
jgi:UDP-N-acetyl-D-glucosamine 4,6-dehydratase